MDSSITKNERLIMIHKLFKKINKGFTLIETLVAISILMIAIAGPLTVANKGQTSALNAKNQSVAINLAQEGIEYINYVKNNRIWGNWEPGSDFSTNVPAYSSCKIDSVCDFPADSSLPSIPANFTRKFYLTESGVPDQVSIIVTVSWSNAGVTNSVTLEQILTNYER